MKVLAVLMVVLSLLLGIVPQFTDCQSHGRMVTLASGMDVPMKCHWSARGEVAVAAPLFLVGIMSGFSRRRESRRNMAILGLILGIVAILLPTALIGVCGNPEMICNTLMRPAIILLGSLVSVVSVVMLISSLRGEEVAA